MPDHQLLFGIPEFVKNKFADLFKEATPIVSYLVSCIVIPVVHKARSELLVAFDEPTVMPPVNVLAPAKD